MNGGPMYLSISSWSEPALATLARVGGPAGVGETLGLPALLVDPQPASSSDSSDTSAMLNLNRQKRTPSTSASGHPRWSVL
jgi:hypothetical protein